jgi:hypothetical protein
LGLEMGGLAEPLPRAIVAQFSLRTMGTFRPARHARSAQLTQ